MLNGRDSYLGTYGTVVSRAEYHRRIAEWFIHGRGVPVGMQDLAITELIASNAK